VKAGTLSDYVQVGLSILDKNFLLESKVCEIIDENVKGSHNCD